MDNTRSESTTIAKSTAQILVANLAKNIALLLVMVTVSRTFGGIELGIFSLGLAITTPFFAFALLGARVLRLTGPNELKTHSIALALLITGAAALLMSLGFALVFTPSSNTAEAGILILLLVVASVAIYKWADLFSELYAGQLQRERQTGKLLVASLISAVLVSMMALLTQMAGQPFPIVVGTLSMTGSVTAYIFYLLAKEERENSSRKLNLVFRLGTPLGLAGGIAVFTSAAPQYVVAATYGPEVVGVLAVALYLYALADLFGAAYGQAWVHRVQEVGSPKAQFRFALKVGSASSFGLLPLATVGVWAFALVAPIVFGDNLKITTDAGVPLSLSIALMPMAHLLAIALFVRFAYRQSLIMMASSAVTVIAASLMLIPPFGLVGALWAVAFGVLARVLAAILLNLRLIRHEGF